MASKGVGRLNLVEKLGACKDKVQGCSRIKFGNIAR